MQYFNQLIQPIDQYEVSTVLKVRMQQPLGIDHQNSMTRLDTRVDSMPTISRYGHIAPLGQFVPPQSIDGIKIELNKSSQRVNKHLHSQPHFDQQSTAAILQNLTQTSGSMNRSGQKPFMGLTHRQAFNAQKNALARQRVIDYKNKVYNYKAAELRRINRSQLDVQGMQVNHQRGAQVKTEPKFKLDLQKLNHKQLPKKTNDISRNVVKQQNSTKIRHSSRSPKEEVVDEFAPQISNIPSTKQAAKTTLGSFIVTPNEPIMVPAAKLVNDHQSTEIVDAVGSANASKTQLLKAVVGASAEFKLSEMAEAMLFDEKFAPTRDPNFVKKIDNQQAVYVESRRDSQLTKESELSLRGTRLQDMSANKQMKPAKISGRNSSRQQAPQNARVNQQRFDQRNSESLAKALEISPLKVIASKSNIRTLERINTGIDRSVRDQRSIDENKDLKEVGCPQFQQTQKTEPNAIATLEAGGIDKIPDELQNVMGRNDSASRVKLNIQGIHTQSGAQSSQRLQLLNSSRYEAAGVAANLLNAKSTLEDDEPNIKSVGARVTTLPVNATAPEKSPNMSDAEHTRGHRQAKSGISTAGHIVEEHESATASFLGGLRGGDSSVRASALLADRSSEGARREEGTPMRFGNQTNLNDTKRIESVDTSVDQKEESNQIQMENSAKEPRSPTYADYMYKQQAARVHVASSPFEPMMPTLKDEIYFQNMPAKNSTIVPRKSVLKDLNKMMKLMNVPLSKANSKRTLSRQTSTSPRYHVNHSQLMTRRTTHSKTGLSTKHESWQSLHQIKLMQPNAKHGQTQYTDFSQVNMNPGQINFAEYRADLFQVPGSELRTEMSAGQGVPKAKGPMFIAASLARKHAASRLSLFTGLVPQQQLNGLKGAITLQEWSLPTGAQLLEQPSIPRAGTSLEQNYESNSIFDDRASTVEVSLHNNANRQPFLMMNTRIGSVRSRSERWIDNQDIVQPTPYADTAKMRTKSNWQAASRDQLPSVLQRKIMRTQQNATFLSKFSESSEADGKMSMEDFERSRLDDESGANGRVPPLQIRTKSGFKISMNGRKSFRNGGTSLKPNKTAYLKPAASHRLLGKVTYNTSLEQSNGSEGETEVDDGPDIRRLYHRTVKHKWIVADLNDEYGSGFQTKRSQLTRGQRRKLSIPAPDGEQFVASQMNTDRHKGNEYSEELVDPQESLRAESIERKVSVEDPSQSALKYRRQVSKAELQRQIRDQAVSHVGAEAAEQQQLANLDAKMKAIFADFGQVKQGKKVIVLPPLRPQDIAPLKRHLAAIIADVDESTILRPQQKYVELKELFTTSLLRYLGLLKLKPTPYLRKFWFAGEKNPLGGLRAAAAGTSKKKLGLGHLLNVMKKKEPGRLNYLPPLRGEDQRKVMVERCARKLIDFLRQPVNLNMPDDRDKKHKGCNHDVKTEQPMFERASLGTGRLFILNDIEKTLTAAHGINEKLEAENRIKLKKRLRQENDRRRALAAENKDLLRFAQAAGDLEEKAMRIFDLFTKLRIEVKEEQSELEIRRFDNSSNSKIDEVKMLKKRARKLGKHLPKVIEEPGKRPVVFSFKRSLETFERLEEIGNTTLETLVNQAHEQLIDLKLDKPLAMGKLVQFLGIFEPSRMIKDETLAFLNQEMKDGVGSDIATSVLRRTAGRDPRLQIINQILQQFRSYLTKRPVESCQLEVLPLNASGVADQFFTRDAPDLDVWEEEELIMDQILENCYLAEKLDRRALEQRANTSVTSDMSDSKLRGEDLIAKRSLDRFNRWNALECERRAHNFITRKEARIGGFSKEELQKELHQNPAYRKKKEAELKAAQQDNDCDQEDEQKKDEKEKSPSKSESIDESAFNTDLRDFMQLVRQNDWVAIICRLRGNKNFGHNVSMLGKRAGLELPSFSKPNLEKRNGVDLLNGRDQWGRTPLMIAFRYKSLEVAGVLLHYGAEHPSNIDCRDRKTIYSMSALKGTLFGFEKITDDIPTLMRRQREALLREVYPKFDLIIYELLQSTLTQQRLSRKGLYSQSGSIQARYRRGHLIKDKKKYRQIVTADMIAKESHHLHDLSEGIRRFGVDFNETAEIRKYCSDLLAAGKSEAYEKLLEAWLQLTQVSITELIDIQVQEEEPRTGFQSE